MFENPKLLSLVFVTVPVRKKMKVAAFIFCIYATSIGCFIALKRGWVLGRESGPKKTFTPMIIKGFCFQMIVGARPYVE